MHLEGSCHASLSPLQTMTGKSWLHIDFWKTLGYKRTNRVAESTPTPDRAGYPWASSLVCRRHAQPGRRRWVAGVVERCGLTASNDWLMARALRERDVAGQGANLASWSFPIPKLGTAPAPTKVWLSHQPPDLATGDGGRPATRLSAEKCTNNLVPSRLGHQQGISSTCDWLSPAAPVSPGILPLTVRRCGRG
jgi:hypothetical protein